MLRAKTLFIVGAGASFEVGMPLGKSLLDEIARCLTYQFEFNQPVKGDRIILQALREAMNEGSAVDKLNDHLELASQLVASASQAKSIDAVIDTLEDERVALVGKLGIARVILGAEGSSRFFSGPEHRPDQIDVNRFAKTWYSQLSSILFDGCRKSNVEEVFANLEIINFNYDRCLETYLAHSVAKFYGLQIGEAQQIVQTMVMHRPYGSLGKLPWYGGEGPHIPLGRCGPQQIEQAAQQVRTFTERVEEEEVLNAIRGAVASADRIIFLGFGFHRQNIDLISEKVSANCEVLGTGVGLSDDACAIIQKELKAALGMDRPADTREIRLSRFECTKFLEEFGRRLTAKLD